MMWTERTNIGLTAGGLGGVHDVFSSVDTFQLTTGKPNNNNNMLTNDQNNTNSLKDRCSNARSRTVSGGDGAAKGDRYKTEMCRTFSENGSCRYGDKCQFEHGIADLRTVSRHPKYKTDLCRTFHSTGFCPYGTRCHFIHAMNEGKASEETNGEQHQTPFLRSTSLGAPPPVRRAQPRGVDTVSVEVQQRLLNAVGHHDLNANILAYLLQSMDVGQQATQQVKSRSQLPALSRHPLSPTHSLDSAASSTSDRSTSPCPSPTDDLFAFPGSGFPYSAPAHHLLSPGSAFSSSSDDSSPVWPTSLIPNLATPPSMFLPSHCQDSFETLAATRHVNSAGPLSNKFFVFA
jgi:hypothetical protein